MFDKQIVKSLGITIFVATLLTGCGGSGGDSQTDDAFSSARLINFSELENYYIITGGYETSSSRSNESINTQKSDSDTAAVNRLISSLTVTLKKSLEDALTHSQNDSSAARASIVDPVEVEETTEDGNIQGTEHVYLQFNTATGKYTGFYEYTNYENVETDACGNTETDRRNGTYYVSGSFDRDQNVSQDQNITESFSSSARINNVTITTQNDYRIDDTIFKGGMYFNAIFDHSSSYEFDYITTMTVQVTEGNESVGLKNYKSRNYDHNGFEYSYPIEGNLYVFTNDLNGYFSVDSTYDHSATPKIKGQCGTQTQSGTEKYIGDNSTLTWTVSTPDSYLIEIDHDNDGIIDETVTGTID